MGGRFARGQSHPARGLTRIEEHTLLEAICIRRTANRGVPLDVGLLVEAIKELRAEVEALKASK